ncbi:ty3-gypsy retrotransposon protein [Tanacetum coccineum]
MLLSRYHPQGSYQLMLSLRVLVEGYRFKDKKTLLFIRSLSRELIFAITDYFLLLNTPADQWLKIVGFNLDGAAAEWFQWMTMNGLITTWARFEESVWNCFGPLEYEDPNGALSKLLQLGTVKYYQREFEKLMNRAMDIPDSLLISFYISGLKLHLRREFLVSRPTTQGDAFSLALITESRLDDKAALVMGTMTKTFGNNGGDESESSVPVTPTENEEAINSGDTSILNYLFRHRSPRSLQLLGTLGTGKVHILIDNGSTHNFFQPGVVEQMKLPVKNTKLFKRTIVNAYNLRQKNGHVLRVEWRIRFDQPPQYSIDHQPQSIQEDLNQQRMNDVHNVWIESRNELLKSMQSLGKMLRQKEQAANLSTHALELSRCFNFIYYDDDDDDEESTIPLNEIISQIPPSIAITPGLPTRESEDTSDSDKECDLPFCDNSVTFSVSQARDSYKNKRFLRGKSIAPDYEDSRAHGFVHRSLKLLSFACLYMGIRYPKSY